MSGKLSTHVLDIHAGRPAAKIELTLWRLDGESRRQVAQTVTNSDGRTSAPLLTGETMVGGTYELVFQVGAYFAEGGVGDKTPFLNEVPVRFTIADAESSYHVPLLVSPWAYSTYRGS